MRTVLDVYHSERQDLSLYYQLKTVQSLYFFMQAKRTASKTSAKHAGVRPVGEGEASEAFHAGIQFCRDSTARSTIK